MPNRPSFEQGVKKVSATARGAVAITPNDSTVLDPTPKGIYVGVSGDIAVIMEDASVVTFPSVPAGIILPVSVSRVKATGTTASGLIGLYE